MIIDMNLINHLKRALYMLLGVTLPALAFAQTGSDDTSEGLTGLDAFITKVGTEIIDPIVTVIALIAFGVFVWGVMQFIRNADNEEKRALGQKHMIWGIIGLTLVFGAAAIVKFISGVAGIGN